jgi:hypothetical protein
MRLFIDMCLDPNSPMSGKLKDTLWEMMKGEKYFALLVRLAYNKGNSKTL